MSTCTELRPDRSTSGRLVRNLALSLSGGALLSLIGAGVAQADEAGTSSDGDGAIGSGDATAVGNQSGTSTNQGVAPSEGSASPTVVTQTATVPNVGIAVANTGGNTAVGNESDNSANATQNATGGDIATSNSGEAANVSDGTAAIYTGSATSHGNVSDTSIDQQAHGALGILTTQDAIVLNAGVGVANTGLNSATGNTANNANSAGLIQTATNTTGLASNSGSATNASNGTATIVTGAASAIGNRSDTSLAQTGGGTGDGDPGGLLVIGQGAAVANLGLGIANTGGNLAVGNASTNGADAEQEARIDENVTAILGTFATNQADVSTSSDGSASIHTGDATATGNDSSTNLTQSSWGDPDQFGAIVSTQVAGVANVGIGAANTGLNAAIGNASVSEVDTNLTQAALVSGGQGSALTSILPVTASNSASVSTASDGAADIKTGDATATGNASDTDLGQVSNATVEEGAMGVLPNVQAAGVLNAGIGVANSGVNLAVGNAAGQIGPNAGFAVQRAEVDTFLGDIDTTGPVTVSNQAEVSTASDGTAKVDTGDATATGNASTTELSQNLDTTIEGMGVIVAPQVAAVVNVGVAVANSGVNAAIGNLSTNIAEVDGASADFAPLQATTVVGPITVGNSHSVSNSSDGEACVCTGDATASGNISQTTLRQDLDVTVEDGFHVVPMTGLVFNAGFGLANSGVNLAIGNVSTNNAHLDQDADLDPAAPAVLVGPQTIVNGGGASNGSDGTAIVGSGNAAATGNLSETTLDQAAVVNGTGVVAPLTATTANVGLGLANSGVNLGVGNASTNDSSLSQTASGTGTVSNQGEASNDSDGTALINPDACDDDKGVPPTEVEEPGAPALPRTGGAIDMMAAVALMLLLSGFAAQEISRRRLVT